MSKDLAVPAKDELKHNAESRSTTHKSDTASTRSGRESSLWVRHATSNPHQLAPSEVLRFQHTIGNRAVSHLLNRTSASSTVQPRRVEHGPNVPPATEATPLRVHATRQPAIQRVVQSKYYTLTGGGFLTKYYSTYDTRTEFDTPDKAWEHDQKLAMASGQVLDPYQRYPTNYSYYNTKERNVMPLSTQGPHTLSHSSISFRLAKRLKEEGGTKRMWQTQILDRPTFRQKFKRERPAKMNKGQRKRFRKDYDLLHGRLSLLMGKGEDYSAEKHELLMRLMQLHPYAAYGKGKAGKKALKHKGERRDAPFAQAFDTRAKFNDEAGYKAFRDMRESMYKDDDKDDG